MAHAALPAVPTQASTVSNYIDLSGSQSVASTITTATLESFQQSVQELTRTKNEIQETKHLLQQLLTRLPADSIGALSSKQAGNDLGNAGSPSGPAGVQL